MARTSSLALVFVLVAATLAQGHFPFIVPEADGSKAKVVYSDTMTPDTNVNIEKIANTKLTLRDGSGKESELAWSKGDGCYLVTVPGTGSRVIYGKTDFGVLQKGEGKPFWLLYYPKAVIGPANRLAVLGDKAALEILPLGAPGKTTFQVQAAGKPVADLEVTVLLPGGGKKAVTTDKEGRTPPFEQLGRFGVYAKKIEAKAGEHSGRKYDEVRHYATLVLDVERAR